MLRFIITPIAIATITLLAFSSNSLAIAPGANNPPGPGRGHVRHPVIGNEHSHNSVGAKALTVKAHAAGNAAIGGQSSGGGSANPLFYDKKKKSEQ
ncbi:MAG: hypothetical protein FJ390_00575 [Verrucomicrobia bacterium]|nr:hypothetical protein [Verrucomicrobiota bacterium]